MDYKKVKELAAHLKQQVNEEKSPLSKAFATFAVTANVADIPEEVGLLECMKLTHKWLVESDPRLQTNGNYWRFDRLADEVYDLRARY